MSNILKDKEIKQFNIDGAILLKKKFEIKWINELRKGINKAKDNPSPRFTNHTKTILAQDLPITPKKKIHLVT